MLRKLTFEDHTQVMDYLIEESAMNLFIIGDIEAFGYESEIQELWGEFNEANEINAILLRFYNSYIPYAKGEFNIEAFVEIISKESGPITLSGKSEVVERFENFNELSLGKRQKTFFCECDNADSMLVSNASIEVKEATIGDVDRIISIRDSIEEFTPNPRAKEMLTKAFETKTGRTYFAEINGEMVACASTTAENSMSAMIVGVCTPTGHRRRGYASLVLEKLIYDVLKEGKTLCLFYDNPEAGRIYKRLGFKDIGMWTMYR